MRTNSYKFSGLASKAILDVSSGINGKKETITLTTSHKKGSRQSRPGSIYVETPHLNSNVHRNGDASPHPVQKDIIEREDFV